MDASQVAMGLGGAVVSSAFALLGLALWRDYRGLTSWHVKTTLRLWLPRVGNAEARFRRQYTLERYWIGGSFAVVGLLCAVGALVAAIVAL